MREIRLDHHGAVDDVVIDNVETFRLERMSAGSWWICAYTSGGGRYVFWLSCSDLRRRVSVTSHEITEPRKMVEGDL